MRSAREAARFILSLPLTEENREFVNQTYGLNLQPGITNLEALAAIYPEIKIEVDRHDE